MSTLRWTAAMVAGGVAAGGLVAGCGPAPKALKCTVVVSSAHPLQRTTQTLSVKTAAGARVITASSSGAHVQPALANAIGLAKVAYGVGNSPVGTRIKVTTTVTKGSQRGVCATSFVPATLPGEPIATRTATGPGSISIAWTEAEGNGLPIIGWRVARDGSDTDGTGAWSTVLPAAATQFKFLSLQSDASYNVSVQAVTAAGTGPATTRTVSTDPYSNAISCDSPGSLNGSFYGAARCDGFWWVGVGSLGAYNVTATRTTGGIVLSYALGSASTASAYDAEGTVSQLDGGNSPVKPRYIGSGIPVNGTEFVAGAFHSGHATLRIFGTGSVPGGPFTFDKSIGINIT